MTTTTFTDQAQLSLSADFLGGQNGQFLDSAIVGSDDKVWSYHQADRRNVASIFRELGCYAEWYYGMKEESFWKLHRILQEEINKQVSESGSRKRKRGYNTRNHRGRILQMVEQQVLERPRSRGT